MWTKTTRKGQPCSQAFLILPFGYIHSNAWDRKSREKWERPGGIYDVDDIRWMQGGYRRGGVQPQNNALDQSFECSTAVLDSRHKSG